MLQQIAQFIGLRPRIDKALLDARAATIARDVDVLSGKLVPIQAPATVTTFPEDNRLSVYPYNGGYLSWVTDVDVQKSPIAEDQYNRIYYTGDGPPKVRGVQDGAELVYNLGVQRPASTATVTAQQKSTVTWTREWHYFYEEADGTQLDPGNLEEGEDAGEVRVVSAGKSFLLPTRPARVTASASSVFVLYFDGFDQNGAPLGRIYPNISASRGNSDLEVAGATISATQINNAVTSVMVLTYDDSRVADYTTYRSYVTTYVTAWGEESRPSTPTDPIGVDPSQDASLTGFPVPVGTDHNIATRKIYRTVTGNSGTAYQFVAEISVYTSTYLDTLRDQDTAELLPSTGWDQPPSDLAALVSHPGGFFGAYRTGAPRTLFFSYPNQPHAWPSAYSITVDYDVVGLAVVGNGFVVMTKGKPMLVYGDHPETLTVTTIPLAQACIAKRGIVTEQSVVLYPSPDGYVAIEGGQGRVVTADYFTKDEGNPAWKDINPSTIRAGMYDKRLHFWTDTHAFVFGLYDGELALTTTSETAQGVYSDIETDRLLIIQGFNLLSWRAGTTRKTGLWRGPQRQLSRSWSPSVCRVTADAYPVTIRLYSGRDSTLVATRTLSTDIAERVPILHDEKFWQVEVESQNTVTEVLISSSMAELESRKK